MSGASILVQPFFGSSSQLQGVTNISGFFRAQFYGGTTVLAGILDCTAAGDAWIDAGVDTSGATVTGCAHAP